MFLISMLMRKNLLFQIKTNGSLHVDVVAVDPVDVFLHRLVALTLAENRISSNLILIRAS